MKEYAERRGWQIVASVKDINGGTKQRPKREELIQMARRRKLDVIVVWRLDRWGRSLSDLTRRYVKKSDRERTRHRTGVGLSRASKRVK